MALAVLKKKLVDKDGNPLAIKGKYISSTFPLHSYAIEGNLAEIKRYIDAGVNMNCRDKQGRTPLHEACCVTNFSNFVKSGTILRLVKLFIESGANPLAVDEIGDTPLHCVARHKMNIDVASYLVTECKVTFTCLNKFGQTPLDVAKESSYSLLAHLKIDSKSLTANSPHVNNLPEVLKFLLLYENISSKSLRELARDKILLSLNPYSNSKLDQLPLPKHLKCYLGGIPFIHWMKP